MEGQGELTSAQARRGPQGAGGRRRRDPLEIAARLGFQAMAAGALGERGGPGRMANPREWERYAGGDDKLAGFFMGKIKAATGGNADLRAASALLQQRRRRRC